jgi:hypothetical protein
MQDNNTAGTWAARDGDGRVPEVDAAGYPGAEAGPGDGRPVAEAEPALLMSQEQLGELPTEPLLLMSQEELGELLLGPPRTGKSGRLIREAEAEAG